MMNQFFILMFLLISCQSAKQESESPSAESAPSAASGNSNKSVFAGKTTIVFVDQADQGIYMAPIKVLSGSINEGETIVAEMADKSFQFKVTSIEVDGNKVKSTSANENNTLFLQTLNKQKIDGFNEGFILYRPGQKPDQSILALDQPKENNGATAGPIEMKCTIDGKAWTGSTFFNSCSYFVKGVKGMDGKPMYDGRPSCNIAFVMTNASGHQLNFNIYDYKGQLGVFKGKDIEVLLSAPIDKAGWMAGHKYPDKNSDFQVEITQYTANSATEATISGKFSGKLKGILGSKPAALEDGEFNNVKIKVFPNAEDMSSYFKKK